MEHQNNRMYLRICIYFKCLFQKSNWINISNYWLRTETVKTTLHAVLSMDFLIADIDYYYESVFIEKVTWLRKRDLRNLFPTSNTGFVDEHPCGKTHMSSPVCSFTFINRLFVRSDRICRNWVWKYIPWKYKILFWPDNSKALNKFY